MEKRPDHRSAGKIKRIAITGPECTGKSRLAEELARHFNTEWVPEYARSYIGSLKRPYIETDILHIAKNQLLEEDRYCKKANGFLFCDTDLIVCKVWSEYVYGRCDQWILNNIREHKYDLYLLTDIDLPWEDDPLREHPDKRKLLFDLYLHELKFNEFPYYVISGTGRERTNNAITNLVNFFSLPE